MQEKAVLGVLVAQQDYTDFGYLGFDGIKYHLVEAGLTGLSRGEIRRACLSLRDKQFARYGKGLFTEDGDLAGSGYCCTKAGKEFWDRELPTAADVRGILSE